MSRFDLSHQLVISWASSVSLPGGADYPTYWVFVLVGRIVEGEIYLLFLGAGPRRRERADWFGGKSAGH